MVLYYQYFIQNVKSKVHKLFCCRSVIISWLFGLTNLSLLRRNIFTTDLLEALVQLGGVQQRPGLPGFFQDGQHDLVPQGCVEADDLLDVAEQLGGLHLGQQAALLQVQQPRQEKLWRAAEKTP